MKKTAEVFLRKDKNTKVVNIANTDKPEITPSILKKWQTIVDLVAKIIDVPSGLIMQITEKSMRVFLKSQNVENPYEKGGNDALGHGLYCETVIGKNSELLVDNALKYQEWKNNPDVRLGMISYYGLPIQWPDKEFFGTVCVLDNNKNSYDINFRDLISEFKFSIEKDLELLCKEQKLQMTLKRTQKQESELKEAYVKLKNMQEELIERRKMAALGSLVTGIAHEINTPVGVGITGITAFIKRNNEMDNALRTKALDKQDLEDFIRFADRSGKLVLKNLNRTADLIKTFKQISSDQHDKGLKRIKLKPYLEEVVKGISSRIDDKLIKIQILCDDGIKITTHPGALSQVMVNLIMNSLSHGFGKDEQGNITIKADLRDSKLEIIYKDDGIGIESNLLPKIFDPFVTSRRQSGKGLGLNIVYNIIKKTFKGTIHCESVKNNGVRFFISVPTETGDGHGN